MRVGGAGVGVRVGVGVSVGSGVSMGVAVCVGVGVSVGTGVLVGTDVADAVGEGASVAVDNTATDVVVEAGPQPTNNKTLKHATALLVKSRGFIFVSFRHRLAGYTSLVYPKASIANAKPTCPRRTAGSPVGHNQSVMSSSTNDYLLQGGRQ